MSKIKDEAMDFDDSGYVSPDNGLHSGTILYERYVDGGKLQLHWNPVLKILVELSSWYVPSGEGDVMPEYDVIGVYDTIESLEELTLKYA